MDEIVTFEIEDDLFEAACRVAKRRGTTVEQLILGFVEKIANGEEPLLADGIAKSSE